MGKTLLVNYVEDGAILLDTLMKKGLQIELAYWHTLAESDRWMLCIVTPMLEENGPKWVYQRIVKAMNQLGSPLSFTILEIAVTSSTIPLVKKFKSEFGTVRLSSDKRITQRYANNNDIVYSSVPA